MSAKHLDTVYSNFILNVVSLSNAAMSRFCMCIHVCVCVCIGISCVSVQVVETFSSTGSGVRRCTAHY